MHRNTQIKDSNLKKCKEVIFRPYVFYVLLLSWIV